MQLLILLSLCLSSVTFSLDLIYTGNTQSYLEPCGCVQGMLGGIARRPHTFPKGTEYILFDSGNFIEISDELDRTRNVYYAKSYPLMGYSAVGVSKSELGQSYSFLSGLELFDLLVASNVSDASGKSRFSEQKLVKGYTFISLVSPSTKVHEDYVITDPLKKASEYADTKNLVLLSSLSSEELDAVLKLLKVKPLLVVANQARGDFETVQGVPVSYPGDKGKFVRIFKQGKVSTVPIEEEFLVSPELDQLVQGYYDAVLKDPSLQKASKRYFENDPHEMRVLQGKNKFIGSQNCKECHQKEYDQYATTQHAKAFDILQEKKRDHVPDCVSCHSVGLGYESGYEIATRQKYLRHVGCESCHGAGLEHFKNPRKDNISKAVSEARCSTCHNAEHSPHFNYGSWVHAVNHSIPVQVSDSQPKPVAMDKADVDLYVMSQCPFGYKAENAMIPVVKKFSDAIQFNLRFIATDVEEQMKAQAAAAQTTSTTSTEDKDGKKIAQAKPEPGTPGCAANFELDPNAKFQSLRGQPEVDENTRQLLVAHFYPDKFLDFLLERNKDVYGDFAAVAVKFGIDMKKIEEGMKSGLGDDLLRKNILPGNQLEISASPTLLINHQAYSLPFETVPLEYNICQSLANPPAWCKTAPVCATDAHCRKPGFDAKCVNPGTAKAECQFTKPKEIKMTVIEDRDCTVCETGPFLRQLYQLYENVSVTMLKKDDERAKELIAKTKIDRLPVYLFDNNDFLASPRTANLQRYLAYTDGVYFVNPLLSEVSSFIRPEKKGTVRLFTTALGQGVGLQKELLRLQEMLKSQGVKMDFQIQPILTQSRNQAQTSVPNDPRYQVMVNTGSGIQPVYLESTYGSREIVESMHQHCVRVTATDRQYAAYINSFSDRVLAGMGGITTQEQLTAYISSLNVDQMRTGAYTDSMIGKELQEKIAQCQTDPNAGPAWLVGSLVETINNRIMASPTVLVNDKIIVRGAPDALLQLLPEMLGAMPKP